MDTVRETKRADELIVGDRIAAEYVPHGDEAEVLFVRLHEYRSGERWVFVAYELKGGFHDSTSYRPDGAIEVTPADHPTGLAYTRADDDTADPTPPGPREPLHTGAMTEHGLVDETPAEPHPTWPTEAELKPWETLAPPASRPAESMEPIDPDSSMEAHYDAETEAMTGLGITEACVITGWAGLCTTHKARHIASGEAKCGCPVYPYAGRGDAADTIVDHRQNCKATS